MAKYDEYGFQGATPVGDFDQRTGTAPGSSPSRTEPPDAHIDPSAVTGDPSGISYELIGPPGSAKSASPQMPGQNDATVISPGADQGNIYTASSDAYTSTGAGQGHADHWTRKPGQQTASGGTA